MIVNKALAAWLGDPAARRATDREMRVLGGEIADIPAFAALKARLPPAVAAGVEAVLALARAFLEDDAAIAAFMTGATAKVAADPFCRLPLRASRSEVHDGLLLFSRPALTIQLAVMSADALAIKRRFREGPASIAFTGQRTLFRFLKAGGATLSIWEAPSIEPSFTASGSGRCRLRERRRLADGDIVEFDGRSESFIVDGAASDLLYLVAATSLGAAPVGAEYDAETLELVAAASTDDASSRTQMMLSLLRIMDRRDAGAMFAKIAQNEHFYARWQAMREFLALDGEAALPHLRAMALADPHSEVRDAAARTLATFFPEQAESPCHA